MPIRFACPSCAKQLKADDSQAGKTLRCAGCRQSVTVPHRESQLIVPTRLPERVDPPHAPAPVAIPIPVFVPAPPPAAEPPPARRPTKPCPFCGEEVLEAAKKCRHCGETIDVTLRAAEEAARAAAASGRGAQQIIVHSAAAASPVIEPKRSELDELAKGCGCLVLVVLGVWFLAMVLSTR